MKKMIVTDLDGTLLNENRKVSENSKSYLKELKEKGYIIVIATGRIYTSALEATDKATFANYIISDTGACCYDIAKKKAIFKNFISKEIAEEILSYYDENYTFIDIGSENKIYKYSNCFVENSKSIKTTYDKNFILNSCKEVTHISIRMKKNDFVFSLYHKLLKKYPNMEIIIMQDSFAETKWIVILPFHCSKYSAIKKLATILQIQNEDILAFGDGLNDKEMLEKCGVGIAMSNALEEVKKVSNDVTLFSNQEEGVICYLQNYFNR